MVEMSSFRHREGKDYTWETGPRWEDDVKVHLQWVQDRVQWHAVAKTKMCPRVS
jgi:hypothetical protein